MQEKDCQLRSKMNKSIGTIRYSPTLNGGIQENWWMIVDCDQDLACYYRKLYNMYHYYCNKLQRPSWEAHITVVRNEEPPIKDAWKKYAAQEIEFNYSIIPRDNGVHYWLEVECEFLLKMREELGLSRIPEFPLHLTFGNSQFS